MWFFYSRSSSEMSNFCGKSFAFLSDTCTRCVSSSLGWGAVKEHYSVGMIMSMYCNDSHMAVLIKSTKWWNAREGKHCFSRNLPREYFCLKLFTCIMRLRSYNQLPEVAYEFQNRADQCWSKILTTCNNFGVMMFVKMAEADNLISIKYNAQPELFWF